MQRQILAGAGLREIVGAERMAAAPRRVINAPWSRHIGSDNHFVDDAEKIA
jgi:hypothetical protein